MSNKKVTILIIVLAAIGVFAVVTLNKQDTSITPSTNTSTGTDVVTGTQQNVLVTYNDSKYGFSFDYPKNDFTETWPDTRFLRVQNYNPQEFTRSMDGEYWLEFFALATENGSSTCPQQFETYDTANQNGLDVYTGKTKADEQSGIAGLQGWCVTRGEIDLFAQGQDETGEKIITQILDSIKFTK